MWNGGVVAKIRQRETFMEVHGGFEIMEGASGIKSANVQNIIISQHLLEVDVQQMEVSSGLVRGRFLDPVEAGLTAITSCDWCGLPLASFSLA
ncbi:hypothetical protein L6452_06439 [Arctium lappa]|uniref:Uncharacterized protein n=1 Tax=Arctium lappa TaxID=4217 RepID=A0ACB9EJ64_ARCLA|nr:hypothetical protein L6452_06439 [Arctium lappa]